MKITGITMKMRPCRYLLTIACTTLILISSNSFANSCSKADIKDYLKSGFTHAQVVKLCTEDSSPQTARPIRQAAMPSLNIKPINSPSSSKSEDQIYLETVIKGDPVTLTQHYLRFKRRECVNYGEENVAGFRDKACVNTETTVYFNGLKVVRATKGTFLFRKQELIVKGHLTRKYLSVEGLDRYKMAAVKAQLPTQPSQLNIPVKKGIHPNSVATRLKKYL